MTKVLTLRPASMADAERLYAWRMDPQTQAASLSGGDFSFDHHCRWLQSSLNRPDRQICIALLGDQPVGMVRADRDGGGWLLSWAIAPAARGQGAGRQMVAAMIAQLQSPVRAEIKNDNPASLRMAAAVGLLPRHSKDGIVTVYSDDWLL